LHNGKKILIWVSSSAILVWLKILAERPNRYALGILSKE
jgi:hypothetical protein